MTTETETIDGPGCGLVRRVPEPHRLRLIGGPHDGRYVPCEREETKPGQYCHFPGLPPAPGAVAPSILPGVHPADVPGHPLYPRSLFYVVAERAGELVAEYAPRFNPYKAEAR